MSEQKKAEFDRRAFLKGTTAIAGSAAIGALTPLAARAQSSKVRVGMMLPATGTFAPLGDSVIKGFKLALEESGGKFAGRELEFFHVDDESNPAKAPEYTNRLIQRDKVDVLVGTVHSGVALGISKIVRQTGTLWLNPVATTDELTGVLCAPNVFRTSFTSWQTLSPLGKVLIDHNHKKVVHITWNYVVGQQNFADFKEGFEKVGGQLVKELWVPFPQVEFQALLTEIASIKPDAVVAWFAGAGAAKFLKDYAAAGLKGKIPLYGQGYLTEGVLHSLDGEAEGVISTFPYGDGLTIPRDKDFRLAYQKKYNAVPDTVAVTGYDTAQLLKIGLEAVSGDVGNKAGMIKGMEAAKIDSPRGPWVMSKAHNPIQDIYLRKVVGRENKVVGVVAKMLPDVARDCKMN